MPAARRVGVLVNGNDPFHKFFIDTLQSGGARARIDVRPFVVREANDIVGHFAGAARDKVDAMVMQASLPVTMIADLGLKYRLQYFPPMWAGPRRDTGGVHRQHGGARPSDRRLREPDSQGGEARRPSGAAAEQVRTGGEP